METNDNKMLLYYFPNFRSNRCIWLIHELEATNDVQFELFNTRDLDKSKVDHYRRTVHPLGTVPALVIEGKEPMIESGAICMYLAELYQKLLPENNRKMDYLNVIFYCCGTIDEILEHLFVQWMFTEPEKRDNGLIQNMMIKFDAAASHLEKLLHNRKFICGDELTAADCVLGYNLWWASVMQGGELLNNHPELMSYYDRLKRRENFKRTFS
ncbi:glutathione S-transferase 1-like [Ostrea edulis]|uniref:glutathione S-transferase 1-like n=1 Tax=Ostrea edulis TaxID=37623 RepID=UPI0024AF26CD|nr:glutathione S-transferase 1-like [Ostrea edulis]